MQYHLLGPTGVHVSRICLGTATFGVAPLEEDATSLVHRAIDLGINFFDTANSYGNQARFDRPGAPPAEQRKSAEELLGNALKGRRHEVVVASKVMEPVGRGPNDRGLSRLHILQQVEHSLRRLQTDYIDIYYAHHPDPSTPIEQTVRAFDDLIRQGKIRYWALSTYPAWQVMEALWTADRFGCYAPVALQMRYNLAHREVEREIIPVCLRMGLALNVFSPLGGGLLAGPSVIHRSYAGSRRWGGSSFSKQELAVADRLNQLANQWGMQPAHLALAWLWSRPAVTAAIIGPESISELEASVAALELQLSGEQLAEVDSISRPMERIPG